jgi:hypothetical protein
MWRINEVPRGYVTWDIITNNAAENQASVARDAREHNLVRLAHFMSTNQANNFTSRNAEWSLAPPGNYAPSRELAVRNAMNVSSWVRV